ncbi:MAG: Hsp20/alpha crystallin family protein [Terriglobia bacterium]
MNAMTTRWDPFRDLSNLHRRLDRLFEDGFTGFRPLDGATWMPAVDILEKDNEIVLKADLPGIDPKDVEINVENGTLMLRGSRKLTSDVKQEDYHRVERVYGSFVRSFSLPGSVDADKVEAAYRNGVLELTLPKRPEAKPKQIKVKVA